MLPAVRLMSQYADKDGKEKTVSNKLSLPTDLANGILEDPAHGGRASNTEIITVPTVFRLRAARNDDGGLPLAG
jgi:hypothetical protein